MLKKDKIYFVFVVLHFTSCTLQNDKNHIPININDDPLKVYQRKNFYKYKDIYNSCNDSLLLWTKDSLSIVETIIFYPYQLDSTFCFNSDSNRFITTVNIRNTIDKDHHSDGVEEFGGAKINGKWYFFFLGGTMVLLREFYKDSEHLKVPLTFEEISFLAHKSIIKNAIKINSDRSYTPNDEYFEKVFNNQNKSRNKGKKIADHDSAIVINAERKYLFKLKPEDFKEFEEKRLNGFK